MIETTTLPIAVPATAIPVLTPRGRAMLRLSEFQDCWSELTAEDRRWFAEDLRDLLVDAVLPETA